MMLRKFNKKFRASAALLKNNDGFSLPELIIAVVILAVASGVILHSFITSSSLTTKAMKLNEASDAAQNIQEILKAYPAADFIDGSSDVLTQLGLNESDFSADAEAKEVVLRNLTSGKSTFDAKVKFSTGYAPVVDDEIDLSEADGFYLINNREIANYTAQKGSFQQSPISNPDDLSDSNFDQYVYSYYEITGKERTIDITITADKTDDEGNVTAVKIDGTYNYTYTYTANKAPAGAAPMYFPAAPYTTSVPVHVQSSGGSNSIELNKDGSPITVYFSYWPVYADNAAREASSSYVDYFKIHNTDDLPVRLVLIKQKPQIKTAGGGYEAMDDVDLSLCENRYGVEIYEYHSMDYIDSIKELNRMDRPKLILTNALLNISSVGGKVPGVRQYKIRGEYAAASGLELNAEEVIDDGNLVNSQKEDRLYDVTIEIFESGKIDNENAAPFAAFNGNKLS